VVLKMELVGVKDEGKGLLRKFQFIQGLVLSSLIKHL
jgi:hypothetical protein